MDFVVDEDVFFVVCVVGIGWMYVVGIVGLVFECVVWVGVYDFF